MYYLLIEVDGIFLLNEFVVIYNWVENLSFLQRKKRVAYFDLIVFRLLLV